MCVPPCILPCRICVGGNTFIKFPKKIGVYLYLCIQLQDYRTNQAQPSWLSKKNWPSNSISISIGLNFLHYVKNLLRERPSPHCRGGLHLNRPYSGWAANQKASRPCSVLCRGGWCYQPPLQWGRHCKGG